MFSLDNFYYILHQNLIRHIKAESRYYYPFGSIAPETLTSIDPASPIVTSVVYYYDQEPVFFKHIKQTVDMRSEIPEEDMYFYRHNDVRIFACGEISNDVDLVCSELNFKNWYYFFHGFVTLHWYKDYQYTPLVDHRFTKVFMCLNRLITKDRSYRLLLVSELINHKLLDHGKVSLSLQDHGFGTWEDELNYTNTKLPKDKIDFVRKHISSLNGSSLIVDTTDPHGSLSADAGPNELALNQSVMWHIVPETVFYYNKLHLTEKIFKPIVSHRPFILVGAVNNLAYLRRYGFKTFSQWIDESYDDEADPSTRISMVVNQIEKLCKLSPTELQNMYEEMKPTLDYNFNHFYGKFKEIITDELLDNFKSCVPFTEEIIDYQSVRQLLLS